MTKTIVYYDDTNNYDKFNEARDLLYERFADSNCWASKEDIPSSSVYEEIDEQCALVQQHLEQMNAIFEQNRINDTIIKDKSITIKNC